MKENHIYSIWFLLKPEQFVAFSNKVVKLVMMLMPVKATYCSSYKTVLDKIHAKTPMVVYREIRKNRRKWHTISGLICT